MENLRLSSKKHSIVLPSLKSFENVFNAKRLNRHYSENFFKNSSTHQSFISKFNKEKSLPIIQPIEHDRSSPFTLEFDEKRFFDKSVGSYSPLFDDKKIKKFVSPSRIVVAIAVPQKLYKNSYAKIKSQMPCQNKAHQAMKQKLKPFMLPNYKFKEIVSGCKMNFKLIKNF